jgi:rubrerythrin
MPEFGSPFSGVKFDRQLSHEELVRAIRFMIAAEYEAVQLYVQLAESTDNTMAQKVLRDIADEEKVHAGEFMALLKQLAPDEQGFYDEGEQEMAEMSSARVIAKLVEAGHEDLADELLAIGAPSYPQMSQDLQDIADSIMDAAKQFYAYADAEEKKSHKYGAQADRLKKGGKPPLDDPDRMLEYLRHVADSARHLGRQGGFYSAAGQMENLARDPLRFVFDKRYMREPKGPDVFKQFLKK